MSFKKLDRKESHLTTDAGCSVQGPARLSTVQRREVCVWRRSIKAPKVKATRNPGTAVAVVSAETISRALQPKQRGST